MGAKRRQAQVLLGEPMSIRSLLWPLGVWDWGVAPLKPPSTFQTTGLDIRDIDSRDRWAFISPRKREPMHTARLCISRMCTNETGTPGSTHDTELSKPLQYSTTHPNPAPCRPRRDLLDGWLAPTRREQRPGQAVAGSWARDERNHPPIFKKRK